MKISLESLKKEERRERRLRRKLARELPKEEVESCETLAQLEAKKRILEGIEAQTTPVTRTRLKTEFWKELEVAEGSEYSRHNLVHY